MMKIIFDMILYLLSLIKIVQMFSVYLIILFFNILKEYYKLLKFNVILLLIYVYTVKLIFNIKYKLYV